MSEWQTVGADGLEAAIAEFKAALPGYWFTVGECQVSADASCGPTRESPDIALIPRDHRCDDGFHADLPQPATIADALRDVQRQALEARAAFSNADQPIYLIGKSTAEKVNWFGETSFTEIDHSTPPPTETGANHS